MPKILSFDVNKLKKSDSKQTCGSLLDRRAFRQFVFGLVKKYVVKR